MDKILLIRTCNKNKNKIEDIKQSWLNQIDIPYFFVYGNHQMQCVENHWIDLDNRTLEVRCNDDYENLKTKWCILYVQ